MSTNRLAFAFISLGIAVSLAPLAFKFNLAAALTDATTSTADQSTTAPASTPELATTSASSTPPAAPTSAPAPSPAPSLTLVRVVGTKYVDYCTDGTKITAYPGDAVIDRNLDKPDAPTPTCPHGQTWDHTSGMDGYDTSNGDLGAGQYAQRPDGSFVVHYPATTYKDATSTSEWPDRVVTTPTSPVAAEAPAAPADNTPAAPSTSSTTEQPTSATTTE